MDKSRRSAYPRVIAVFVGFVLLSCSNGSAHEPLEPSATSFTGVQLPPEVIVGGSPCEITYLEGSVWVSDLSADRVIRIDAATRAVLGTYPVGTSPCWIVGDTSGIWVAPTGEGSIQLLDPQTGLVAETIEVSIGPADAKLDIGFGDLWATVTPDGGVVRIDTQTRSIIERIHVGKEPRGVVTGGGFVWVAVEGANRVVAIDPSTNRVARSFRVRAPSAILAATKRTVWVGQLLAERASRLRASDGRVVRSYPLVSNLQPGEIIDGSVWTPDHLNSEVLRFSSNPEDVGHTEVGAYPSALVRIGGEVWVANFGDGSISIVEVPDS